MGKVTQIVNANKKSGEKNGKAWKIMSIEVEDGDKVVVADTFDNVEVGSEVRLQYDAEYKSYKAFASRGGGSSEGMAKVMAKLDAIEKKIDALLGNEVPNDPWA